MLFIDSLYINNSGGFMLLDYLAKELTRRNIPFSLLADGRCRGRLDYCKRVEYMEASMWGRKQFYRNHKSEFSSVFCFGNIPAPIRLSVPVYTYFHNINLLTLAEAGSMSQKMVAWLKRAVFRYYKHNTNYWIVQTWNTACELKEHLREEESRIKIMPFYELPDHLKELKGVDHGDDYLYNANYTGAKGHEELLKAWQILHQRRIDKKLHLTVPSTQTTFLRKVRDAQEQGVCVENHGFIPFKDVVGLYRQSKALVYPSHNESLGLGIIEAIEAGCDVIGADLPYIHAICKPSETFTPYSAESIAESIERYEMGNSRQSELHIRNMIDELIGLITEPTCDSHSCRRNEK